MEELLRLLEVLRRELGATDVRAEVGGAPPDDPHVAWRAFGPYWRIVVRFAAPAPLNTADRLGVLLEPFADVARLSRPPALDLGPLRQRELDAELISLSERAGASAAVVFDERSPVLWGTSEPRAIGWDLGEMERLLPLVSEVEATGLDSARWLAEGTPDPDTLTASGVDETTGSRWAHRFARFAGIAPEWDEARWRRAIRNARAISAARAECRGGHAPDRVVHHDGGFGILARGFAQLYLVAVIFDGPFSELHAEGAIVRALPLVERLVLALPPVEPPPAKAKVIALPRPRG